MNSGRFGFQPPQRPQSHTIRNGTDYDNYSDRYKYNTPPPMVAGPGPGMMSYVTGGGYIASGLGGVSGPAGWTHTGGLSLPITIPTVGTETVFSKVGGSPTLTISLRPRQAWTRSLTWLWSLCWGLLAVWVVRRIRTASSATSLRPVLIITAALGVLGYLLLPDYADVRTLSLWVFIVSLLAVMLIGVQREVTDELANRAA